jgi:threonyl-tRNA synthetase (EC 6.1.1.3)/Ser-tRNA(Thr) hydrolase (EC 3.1.1.-)
MQEIVEADYDIERVVYDREDAVDKYEGDNEYKLDILEAEASGDEQISFYEQAEFEDLCKGPHVESTGEIGAFKLLNISSSYWRGDEDNDTLTRVHGTAFEKESDLEEFLTMREEAKERDHRKLGQELDLFSIPTVRGRASHSTTLTARPSFGSWRSTASR